MARIKKPGLDYFPLDTQFVNNRTVRRIMKQQGDAALAVLINVYCAIYAGHGYYVEATDLFYEDLADNLYTMDTAGVRRTIRLALDYGLFHADLYREHGILTSEGIQRQYFFSVKRRSTVRIDPRFCLLPPDEAPAPAPEAAKESAAETPQSVTDKPQSATNKPINADLAYRGTHSIAQNSTAQSLLPPDSPPAPQVPQAAEAGGADTWAGKALQKEWEEAVGNLNMEELKEKINWELVFGDLENASKDSLEKVKKQLINSKDSMEIESKLL